MSGDRNAENGDRKAGYTAIHLKPNRAGEKRRLSTSLNPVDLIPRF
jgi:hypothetical protein